MLFYFNSIILYFKSILIGFCYIFYLNLYDLGEARSPLESRECFPLPAWKCVRDQDSYGFRQNEEDYSVVCLKVRSYIIFR